MSQTLLALLAIPAVLLILCLYLWHVNRGITVVPPEALALSPHRWTTNEIESAALQFARKPIEMLPYLPPRTGRRYIVVGGSGFVGGWIVLHLLLRGEEPRNIRIVDLRSPTRKDLLSSDAANVAFVPADVRDLSSLRTAFAVQWPGGTKAAQEGVTVFNTVAGIRFYERHPSLISRSSAVNVDGAQNVLTVAQEMGVDVLIYTSSASIPVCRTNFWIWPWQKHPKTLVQIACDSTSERPRKHKDFFSNYAYTKYLAEKLVREANNPAQGFRTGCLRPGNAVFGSGGDLNAGAYLVRGLNPSWVAPMIQSFTYVENVSYAHLLYEQRLLEASTLPPSPLRHELGGQTFLIADSGDPISYGDLYLALSTLSKGRAQFPQLPASPMLVLANIIEFYYVMQNCFPRLLPALSGDVVNLQPSIFDLVTIHLKVDDSRARLPPSAAGLGYQPPWTTLDGLCQLVTDHLKNGGMGEKHQRDGGGISLGFRRNTATVPGTDNSVEPLQVSPDASGLKHR